MRISYFKFDAPSCSAVARSLVIVNFSITIVWWGTIATTYAGKYAVPARIAQIHGIVEAVAVSICPDAWLCDFEPVWLDEQAEFWVEVACVAVLQSSVRIKTLADEAFGVFAHGGQRDVFSGREPKRQEVFFARGVAGCIG